MMLSAAWSRLSLRTKSLVVLSIPLVPLGIAISAITLTARQQDAARQLVSHTLAVKEQIAAAFHVTRDSEVAVKDFWLSRDARAVARFESAQHEWAAVSGQLLALVEDDPVQAQFAEQVRARLDDRPLRALQDYLNARPDADRPPPELLERSASAIEAVRADLAEMQRVEDRRLIERSERLRAADARVLRIALLGALFGIVGGVIGSLAFSREVSRRILILGENAFSLVREQPLQQVDPSRDEVGVLGQRLHELWALTSARIRSLDLARAELDQFFSVSLDMLCIASLDGYFVRVNPAWQQTLGWDASELMARPYLEFIHPDDVERTRHDAARQGERSTVVTLENRYRCKDGSYRWLSWKSVSHPELGLIFAAARDVTDHRRVNIELQARVTELRELNHELEAFSYSVSHDLRAPLRHVTGFNGFIERSASDRLSEQERRWLSQSIAAAQRMGRLIDDLLEFSRMGRSPIARDRVSLDALLRDARHEVGGGDVLDGRHIEWRISPLPEIRGDASMLRHVFVNLLDNAVKYTRERPTSTIEVGTLSARDGEVVIFVRDNGVGFDMQYAHKLFGVFQRLHGHDEFDGTGIGLANVRRIIVRHGGHTWAEGVVGKGATFYVSLPLVHEGVAA